MGRHPSARPLEVGETVLVADRNGRWRLTDIDGRMAVVKLPLIPESYGGVMKVPLSDLKRAPAIKRSRVVLPAPLGPTKATD